MMRIKPTILLLFLFFFNAFVAIAQKKDSAIYKALYQFRHVDDSTKRNLAQVTDMVLYIGQKGTLYREISDEESYLLLYLSKGGTEKSFDILEEAPSLVFINQKSIDTKRIIDNMYQIVENQQNIHWDLLDESKEIKGYLVQKAKAKFKGRVYTAWFTTEIPFPYGPWKLRDLPGLILEARDHLNDIEFKFKGFEKIDTNQMVAISQPKTFKIKKVSTIKYEEIYKNFLQDQDSFIANTLGVSRDIIIEGVEDPTKAYNNPIELSEK